MTHAILTTFNQHFRDEGICLAAISFLSRTFVVCSLLYYKQINKDERSICLLSYFIINCRPRASFHNFPTFQLPITFPLNLCIVSEQTVNIFRSAIYSRIISEKYLNINKIYLFICLPNEKGK